jgi:hypothetical protein
VSHRRVLRYEVPVDDDWHTIGGGRVVHVDNRPQRFTDLHPRLEVWTEEHLLDDWPATPALTAERRVIVVGTGHQIPPAATQHLGSVLDGPFVWHLFAEQPPF